MLTQSYVDDILIGVDTEEKLVDLVKKVLFILEEASLPSNKYVSNSLSTLEQFPPELVPTKERVSILGFICSPRQDVITFNMTPIICKITSIPFATT